MEGINWKNVFDFGEPVAFSPKVRKVIGLFAKFWYYFLVITTFIILFSILIATILNHFLDEEVILPSTLESVMEYYVAGFSFWYSTAVMIHGCTGEWKHPDSAVEFARLRDVQYIP